MTDDQWVQLEGLLYEELVPHVRELRSRTRDGKPDPWGEAHAALVLVHCLRAMGVTVHHGDRAAIIEAINEERPADVRIIVSVTSNYDHP